MAAVRRRETRQRAAVIDTLDALNAFVTPQELHARMRQNGDTVGLATVYRTLQGLADAGRVDTVRTDEGEAIYRRCSTSHHHHLVCRVCRRTVEVDSVAVERWAAKVAQENDFADVDHVVEVFGICAQCAAEGRATLA